MSNAILGRLLDKVRGGAAPHIASARAKQAEHRAALEEVLEAERCRLLEYGRFGKAEHEEFLVGDAEVKPYLAGESYRVDIVKDERAWPVTYWVDVPCLSMEPGQMCRQEVVVEFSSEGTDRVASFFSAAKPVAAVKGGSDWHTKFAVDWIENFVIVPAVADSPEWADMSSCFADGFEDFVWAPEENVLVAELTNGRGYMFVMRGGLAPFEDLVDLRGRLLDDMMRLYGGDDRSTGPSRG